MRTMTTCTGTLVLHHDGTHECEHGPLCPADTLSHEWWIACDELGCGCAEHEMMVLALAA